MAGANQPEHKKYAYLRQLSVDTLLELLSVAPVPASSPEEEAYTDALEEAILEKEQESPTGVLPDVNRQWAEFQAYYSPAEESPFPDVQAMIEAASSAEQDSSSPGALVKRPVRPRRIWRTALTAAALVLCILGCMVAAQAAGVDVFRAMARWTESTFSLGTVRTDGAKKVEASDASDNRKAFIRPADDLTHEYSSLQEALDAYGVTEVTAPVWIPEGYVLNRVDILYVDDPEQLIIDATYYLNEGRPLNISIASYTDEPSGQVEKTDAAPETFEVGGITFYLIENTVNYTVAWLTDHYECYIGGAKGMDQETLREIVYSMFTSS